MTNTSQIPSHYQTVIPYLILQDVATFIEFTQEVFNAEEEMEHLDDNGRIMHAEIIIGGSTIMAGQNNEQWKSQPAGLYINVDSADETYQKALDAGASSVMKPSTQDYGRTCGVLIPAVIPGGLLRR